MKMKYFKFILLSFILMVLSSCSFEKSEEEILKEGNKKLLLKTLEDSEKSNVIKKIEETLIDDEYVYQITSRETLGAYKENKGFYYIQKIDKDSINIGYESKNQKSAINYKIVRNTSKTLLNYSKAPLDDPFEFQKRFNSVVDLAKTAELTCLLSGGKTTLYHLPIKITETNLLKYPSLKDVVRNYDFKGEPLLLDIIYCPIGVKDMEEPLPMIQCEVYTLNKEGKVEREVFFAIRRVYEEGQFIKSVIDFNKEEIKKFKNRSDYLTQELFITLNKKYNLLHTDYNSLVYKD